jgi:uncharacterized repeat protein (TIGR01451 family)
MNIDLSQLKRASLAIVALGSIGVTSQAYAVGTAANTQIDNRATVNYTVGTVAQTPIESSPTGNSTPGVNAGANTSFVVDNRVDLTVTEVGGAATATGPGANNVVTTFTVTNTGNSAQGYALAAANRATGTTLFSATDAFDMNNLRVFVETDNVAGFTAGDTATAINTLAADATVTVYIVADTPLTALNGQAANVRLTATTAVAGTNGATLVTETAGADTAGAVDVVFGDGTAGGNTARDGAGFADDQYLVAAAALTVAKTSSVFNDPFNGGTNPKAIPGAVVEYSIVVTNSAATSATGVVVTDPIPANTAFVASGTNAYNAGASNVQINVGSGAPAFCVAEAGSDTNSDGCFRTAAGVLTVGSPAVSSVATGAANAVTVRFRVTIN